MIIGNPKIFNSIKIIIRQFEILIEYSEFVTRIKEDDIDRC